MSESKGLQGDLDQAFRDYFEFNGGSSHYFHAHTPAPDPRVNINIPDLKLEGPISLPLSASVAVEMGKATVRDKKHWDSIFDGLVSGYWRRDRGGSEAEESEDDSEDESEDEPKNEREDEEEAGGIPPNPVAISPYKVKLGQAWGQFLDKRVMDRVWTALGAPPIDLNSISSHYKLANATAHLPGPISVASSYFSAKTCLELMQHLQHV
ncbi:hypothetical protein D9611_006628 [Ephemerocybe angulata]|uniref:Uncharacterized protein n=1 Tax=Ephemerocybe angulata TaxID=980116 RepID=A0A8H5C943_9AGAR|nr:hypothetical protein D9611_006628 [Tulosesus angulatus]